MMHFIKDEILKEIILLNLNLIHYRNRNKSHPPINILLMST